MENDKNNSKESQEYFCDKCGAKISIEDKVCPKCGADVSEIEEVEHSENNEEIPSKRYPALRTIAEVYETLAWLIVVVAVIGILWSFINLGGYQSYFGIILLASSILVGVVGCITFLACSESIKVFIDIEENTRKTAESVNKKDQKKD